MANCFFGRFSQDALRIVHEYLRMKRSEASEGKIIGSEEPNEFVFYFETVFGGREGPVYVPIWHVWLRVHDGHYVSDRPALKRIFPPTIEKMTSECSASTASKGHSARSRASLVSATPVISAGKPGSKGSTVS